MTRKQLKHKVTRKRALEAVRDILIYIGEDVERPGLVKTPERVIKAWENDWALGYSETYVKDQLDSIVNGRFDDGAEQYDQMICMRKIKVLSFCEHHLCPFLGQADVAYIPALGGPILGLSKLVRVVDLYSKRLQVQERLTSQIADFIQAKCHPIGVGVVIRATHMCMVSRGVRQHESYCVTSALRGEMLTDPAVKAEFLALCRGDR